MLEKYKKLAHDASLNGDRVLTEYYLQFADHYFRVVADSRDAAEDDQRPPRQHDRDQPYGTDDYDTEDRDESRARRAAARPLRRRAPIATTAERDRDATKASAPREARANADEAAAEDNPFVRERARPGALAGALAAARSGQRPRGRGRPANDARRRADAEAHLRSRHRCRRRSPREPREDEARGSCRVRPRSRARRAAPGR